MKRTGLLALALYLAPVLVSAQPAPAAPPGAPGAAAANDAAGAQRFAAMQQMHQQMQQIHLQARAQILAALSAQHRTMVANVISGLVVANNPDATAAARQIDALLSPGEKQAVINIHTTARASMRTMMQTQHAQFEAGMTGEQRAKMQQHEAAREAAQQVHPHDDAGSIVLHMLGHFGGAPGEGMHEH